MVRHFTKIPQLQYEDKNDPAYLTEQRVCVSLWALQCPNTVQKAYKQLETEGYIYSVKGKGNFVASYSNAKDSKKISELYNNLQNVLKSLVYLGESEEKIYKFIKEKIKW